MKKKRRLLWILPGVAFFCGGLYVDRLLPVITGYAAKNLASGVFVAGRSQESIEREDLNFSWIRFARNRVDPGKKEVVSRLLWRKSKAVLTDGAGCVLVRDFTEDEIKNRPYDKDSPVTGYPDGIAWPTGDLLPDTFPAGINRKQMDDAVAKVMSDTLPFKGTFAFMVAWKGVPVAEAYREDFDANTRFLSWSMAKSVTSALTGLRVKEGKMDLNAPVVVREREDRRTGAIALNHLLRMNSGLEWNEDYGNLSDVTVMLYTVGDMARYAAEKPSEAEPGVVWKYASGATNIACRALRQSFPDDAAYYAYPRQALFDRIGMRSAVFEVDASGTFAGSSYLYATMRDYVRFALLYLNRGNWEGEQLLPEEWVEYTMAPAEGSGGKYGASFWLNLSGDQPDMPKDACLCKGHDGQYIVVIPSRDLVVARTGYSPGGTFDVAIMLREILEALPS